MPHEIQIWTGCGTTQNREFKISRRWTPRKRRFLKLSKFAFFRSLSRLIQLIYFVKCKRTLFEPNSKEPCSSSERERKFSRRLFTSSIKCEIRHFRVVVVQWRQRNVQKSVMHVQSCCFAYSTYCFIEVLVVLAVMTSQFLKVFLKSIKILLRVADKLENSEKYEPW